MDVCQVTTLNLSYLLQNDGGGSESVFVNMWSTAYLHLNTWVYLLKEQILNFTLTSNFVKVGPRICLSNKHPKYFVYN